MRTSPLLGAAVAILIAGCTDSSNPTAPLTDAGPDLHVAESTAPMTTLAASAVTLAPDPADRILLDTRTTLQQARSISYAKEAFGTNVSDAGPWAFTSNVDGEGTNAMRIDWPRKWTSKCRYATATLGVPLPTPRASRMFVQWKQHLGRTETGGGVGRVGEFRMADGCTGLGRAEWTVLRDVTPRNDAQRVEYRWMAPSPLEARVSVFTDPALRLGTVPGIAFEPAAYAGRTVTQTLYVQAESAPGARDGIVRLWVDGTLVLDQTGVALGTAGFRRIRFPGRMALATRPQTEYFWDVVAWEPASDPEEPAPVATIHVTPASGTISVGSNLPLRAVLLDANGDTLRGRAVTWQSSAPTIATVGIDGVVAGLRAGSTTITASAEGRSGSAEITVQDVPVASVSVAPTAPSIETGRTVQLTATVRDANGNELTGRTIAWETSAAGIATVSSSGLVTGVAAGKATITARSEGKSASTEVTVTAPAPAPVASVTVTPPTATIRVGETQQLAATLRDAQGAILTGRAVAWQSLNASIATVSTTGLVTGAAAGTARVRATSEGVADTAIITVESETPPPPPNGIADPTLLPRATSQRPAAGSYGRNLAAGQTYIDPNSGVTVLKLTSASVPASNGGMYHGYSEGGPNISQAWTGGDGQVYYTAKVGSWLVDIRYSTFTPVNWRRVSYDGEIGLAFSMNPATPRIAFIVNGKRVDRYNTATNSIENTGNWPWVIAASGTSPQWLQTQLNDTWVVAMLQSNTTIVAFRPSDGFERAVTASAAGVGIDEPHLDREFPVVYLAGSAPIKNKMVNLETGAFRTPTDPNGIGQDSHAAPLRGKLVAQGHWQANAIVATDINGRVWPAISPTPTDVNGDYHFAGQWVFNNPSEYFVVDQWASSGNNAIYRGMMGFVSITGDVRLIGAHDAVGTSYAGGQPHPTLAQDGKLVMWTTNMNGSGRYDTFIARVPVR